MPNFHVDKLKARILKHSMQSHAHKKIDNHYSISQKSARHDVWLMDPITESGDINLSSILHQSLTREMLVSERTILLPILQNQRYMIAPWIKRHNWVLMSIKVEADRLICIIHDPGSYSFYQQYHLFSAVKRAYQHNSGHTDVTCHSLFYSQTTKHRSSEFWLAHYVKCFIDRQPLTSKPSQKNTNYATEEPSLGVRDKIERFQRYMRLNHLDDFWIIRTAAFCLVSAAVMTLFTCVPQLTPILAYPLSGTSLISVRFLQACITFLCASAAAYYLPKDAIYGKQGHHYGYAREASHLPSFRLRPRGWFTRIFAPSRRNNRAQGQRQQPSGL